MGNDEKKKRKKKKKKKSRVEMRSGLSTKEKMAKPPDFFSALILTHSVGVRCRSVVCPLADDEDAAAAVLRQRHEGRR